MKKLVLTILIAMSGICAKAQMLAVNNDVLMDVMMTPNIGFELVVGERTTVGASIFGNYKPWGKDIKMIGVQPEYRYFFSGRPMHKFFVGAGALLGSYDITWSGKFYDGVALGGGLTFGYVINISNRLNIDCHAGFGAIIYKHKEYFENDNYDIDFSINGMQRTNAKGYYLLPTRIGVSLSYILK